VVAGVLLFVGLGALWLFPGPRLGVAFTVATGVGRRALQQRVDAMEARAIAKAPFSDDERAFLGDFYRTLATGAKLSVLVAQTGRLMDHYLDGSGLPYQLEPQIFRDNNKVQAQVARLEARLSTAGCGPQRLHSSVFYMPDASQTDSVFGLYYGTVSVSRQERSGRCVTFVRAEVPWHWPSYDSLLKKHGDYHAESFPLPNLQSLLADERRALFVDNGLGQYLAELNLARPFLAFAEWEE
jgi:hypothetical protein